MRILHKAASRGLDDIPLFATEKCPHLVARHQFSGVLKYIHSRVVKEMSHYAHALDIHT